MLLLLPLPAHSTWWLAVLSPDIHAAAAATAVAGAAAAVFSHHLVAGCAQPGLQAAQNCLRPVAGAAAAVAGAVFFSDHLLAGCTQGACAMLLSLYCYCSSSSSCCFGCCCPLTPPGSLLCSTQTSCRT